MDAAAEAARQEADGVAADAQAGLSKSSVLARGGVVCPYQPHPARVGAVLCVRSLESLLLVHPRLGGEEDSTPPGAGKPASRVRMEGGELGGVVRHVGQC